MALLILLVLILAFFLLQLWSRQKDLALKIQKLESTVESMDRAQLNASAQIRKLTLESMGRTQLSPVPQPPAPVKEPARAPEIVPEVREEPESVPFFERIERKQAQEPEPEPEIQTNLPLVPPMETDWEARIGGNWANKAGVAVLIIGLALFLQYSLTHLGPAGRVALGYVLSISLLATGVLLESRLQWQTYARGLIGGGWAGIYFTTFAAHALPAARVIDSPMLATALLLAVSIAMVVHSLRYRSQTVTGLSYFVTFGTLALTPLSAFAVVAVVPLAASLLYLARRFQWYPMISLGQVAVYLLYLIHMGSLRVQLDRLIYGQVILAIYCLLFEGSELTYFSVDKNDHGALRWSFLANAFAVIALSLVQWEWSRPAMLWVPCFLIAVLYLLSTLVRASKYPAAGEQDNLLEHLVTGGYEGALAISAGLTAWGIYSACRGLWIDAAWVLEAEILFACALYFRRDFPLRLAGIVFVLPAGKLCFFDIGARPTRWVRHWFDWPKLALTMAAVFLINRVLRKELIAYSFAAVTLICTVISFEAPAEWVAVSWLVLATGLFELGLLSKWRDFRSVAYAVAIPAGISILIGDLQNYGKLPTGIAAAVITAAQFVRVLGLPETRLSTRERTSILNMAAGLTMASLLSLAVLLLPDWLLAPVWFLIALAAMEVGFRCTLPIVRAESHLAVAFATFAGLAYDLLPGTAFWGISHSVVAITPAIGCYYYLRFRITQEAGRGNASELEIISSRVYLYVAAFFSLLVVNTATDRVVVPVGWAIIGIILLAVSTRRQLLDLRVQAYLIALATFVRTSLLFETGEQTFGISSAIVAGCPVIALFFASEFLLPRKPSALAGGRMHVYARPAYCAMASLLLAGLLYSEVRGSLLTVAWGSQGLLTLAAGFPLRERTLRLSGLAIFLLCVLKLFFHDLSVLATPYRILSFVVLGLLLLGTSGLYTRYKETIKQFL